MSHPILQLSSVSGLGLVLVNEGGAYKICLTDGEGIRVYGIFTPRDARRAARFLEGILDEATRPRDPDKTATALKPIPPRQDDEDGF